MTQKQKLHDALKRFQAHGPWWPDDTLCCCRCGLPMSIMEVENGRVVHRKEKLMAHWDCNKAKPPTVFK